MSWLRWGELGLGGLLGLELLEGVECLVESESGSRSRSWSGSEMLRDEAPPPKSEAVRVMCVLLLCCLEILDSGRGLSLMGSS